MSSSIQNVSSCPDYIDDFIKNNIQKLLEIYNEGYESNNQEGCLGFNCDKETNKMDVMFLNKSNITSMMTSDSWEKLKLSIPENKKLFLIKDIAINSIFLMYI